MGRLIDDLLNFCRLGKLALQPAGIDMGAIVRDVYGEFRAREADRQVEFRLHDLPSVAADAVLVRQVWTNLLDNALKYTRHRTCAQIEIGGFTTDGEHVYFIRDNGIGFQMQYADKLFGVFQRLHGTDEFEGNGVGLALVRRIVQLHNGRVWAESKPDQGAAFYFALPRHEGSQESLP
jgi:light-regulated signal transduction histidine kinase (bacteriophytochrome)